MKYLLITSSLLFFCFIGTPKAIAQSTILINGNPSTVTFEGTEIKEIITSSNNSKESYFDYSPDYKDEFKYAEFTIELLQPYNMDKKDKGNLNPKSIK